MLYRARIVLPVTAPPVEDGAVLVSGGTVVAVGRWEDLRRDPRAEEVCDLGDVILMPGLINAHCHLEYTHMAGYLAPPRHFTDWLQGVLALKSGWSFSEFAASWIAGARQLVTRGCTTVMDFEAVPELLPELWHDTPLRVISGIELTGVRAGRRAAEILAEGLGIVDRLTPAPSGKSAVLAPHAPYSTRPELLELCGRVSRDRGWPLACHVSESAEEFEMFCEGGGAMYQWLRPQREMMDCGLGSPLRHVAAQGMLGSRTLLIHMNYLAEGDLDLIRGTGTSVVHCPRSHDYFRHAAFPFEDLKRAGVPLALGTDSLLSVRKLGRELPRLDLFAEMQAFHGMNPGVDPAEVLGMATAGSARALGLEGRVGEVKAGAHADLIVLRYQGGIADAYVHAMHHVGDVPGVMIGGQWVVDPAGKSGAE